MRHISIVIQKARGDPSLAQYRITRQTTQVVQIGLGAVKLDFLQHGLQLEQGRFSLLIMHHELDQHGIEIGRNRDTGFDPVIHPHTVTFGESALRKPFNSGNVLLACSTIHSTRSTS